MRVVAAILVSLLVHAFVAAGLVAYMRYSPGCDSFAELDLSSVELSFAEEDSDTAPPSVAAYSVQEEIPPRPPKEAVEPLETMDETLPPDFDAMKLPEPKEEKESFDTPPEEPEPPKTEPPKPEEPAVQQQPAAAAPKQGRIDAPPKPKRQIKPEYPIEARKRGEEGDVVFEITVAEDGTVKAAKIIESCGFRELEAAAMKAVMSAKFTPAKSGRKAVESTARLTLNFKLRK